MKRNIKKSMIFFGAVAVALVMLSSVTAVPNVESELLMEEFEEQKNEMIKQLDDLWLTLLEDDSLNIAEWQAQNDVNPGQDFEDLFDMDGFLEFIISDDFVDFLKDHFDTLQGNEGVLFLFNNDEMQTYLNSEEFLYFANTDEVQYILEKLHEDDDSVQEELQGVGLGVQQATPLLLEGITGNGPVTCQTENGGFEAEALEDFPLLELFILIMVALITWIPAIVAYVIFSPIAFIYFFFAAGPFGPVLCAIIAILVVIAELAAVCFLWPFIFIFEICGYCFFDYE